VPGDSARLSAAGLPLVATIGTASREEPPRIVFHQAASGAYLELVTSASRAAMFGDEDEPELPQA
jgi:hypothetical protein